MNRFIVLFFLLFPMGYFDCTRQQSESILFYDCIILGKKYCISYETDVLYTISDTTGISWGTDKSYRFFSGVDTLSIALYMSKIDEKALAEYLDNFQAKSVEYMNSFYACENTEFKEMDFFFKGYFISCKNEKNRVMRYTGYNISPIHNNDISIIITSIGNNDSKFRRLNFEKIIKTVKIETLER